LPDALRERLTRARASQLLRHPFFGYLVCSLEDRFGADWLPTVATDGRWLFWNDPFVVGLSANDLMFVLAHEAMHCALQHLWRRESRDAALWNIACDMCVNDALADSGLSTSLPLLRGSGGRAAEAVYASLRSNACSVTPLEPIDDHSNWPASGRMEVDDRAAIDGWHAAVQQARSFGSVPRALERWLEEVSTPRRDWRGLLREGLVFPEDYRRTPTDRRFSDILLPTLTGVTHRVVVAVDTSASIDGGKLAAFWSELRAILRNNRCEARVMTCDAEIQNEWSEHEFDAESVALLSGGGGTDFRPVFERLERYAMDGWSPEALVFLTDLDGRFPDAAPTLRTIWVVERADGWRTPPFGEVVVIAE
jgi:predicted metal-dependent peptidase